MSADPTPDQPVDPAITALLHRYADAWAAGDIDAMLECFALPHVIVTGDRREFLEDEDAARTNLEALAARYAANGVTGHVLERSAMLPLPDGAARVSARWRLTGADGAEVLRFPTLYTLADDGGWRIVAVDAQGEADAWAGAGWA